MVMSVEDYFHPSQSGDEGQQQQRRDQLSREAREFTTQAEAQDAQRRKQEAEIRSRAEQRFKADSAAAGDPERRARADQGLHNRGERNTLGGEPRQGRTAGQRAKAAGRGAVGAAKGVANAYRATDKAVRGAAGFARSTANKNVGGALKTATKPVTAPAKAAVRAAKGKPGLAYAFTQGADVASDIRNAPLKADGTAMSPAEMAAYVAEQQGEKLAGINQTPEQQQVFDEMGLGEKALVAAGGLASGVVDAVTNPIETAQALYEGGRDTVEELGRAADRFLGDSSARGTEGAAEQSVRSASEPNAPAQPTERGVLQPMLPYPTTRRDAGDVTARTVSDNRGGVGAVAGSPADFANSGRGTVSYVPEGTFASLPSGAQQRLHEARMAAVRRGERLPGQGGGQPAQGTGQDFTRQAREQELRGKIDNLLTSLPSGRKGDRAKRESRIAAAKALQSELATLQSGRNAQLDYDASTYGTDSTAQTSRSRQFLDRQKTALEEQNRRRDDNRALYEQQSTEVQKVFDAYADPEEGPPVLPGEMHKMYNTYAAVMKERGQDPQRPPPNQWSAADAAYFADLARKFKSQRRNFGGVLDFFNDPPDRRDVFRDF